MKAIAYDVNLGTYALGKALGGRWPGLYWSRLSSLRYGERARPAMNGEEQALVRVRYAGVCGSDMAAVCHASSPALTPFTSFPSVLGHEIMGTLAEADRALPGFAVGERVVVQPFLSCTSRGLAVACRSCREGLPCLCHATTEGPLAPGMIMGACRDRTGGWAEYVSAHRSQLFRLPDALSDLEGVLVEPLSIGVHAVLRRCPDPGGRVLVIGSGMMAFAAIASLRMLGIPCTITHLSHLVYQRDMGQALGADEAICLAAGDDPTERMATLTGAKLLKPLMGRRVPTDGFDLVYDCVGTAQSLQDAFYFTRARGTIVLIGAPGELPGLDWTFVWARELTIVGSLGYGLEQWEGEAIPTFELTMRLMQRSGLPLADLVTHRFALSRYREALDANVHKASSQAIKTVFTPEERCV